MKKTLVIMGTHPNGLKTFDWSRTDCDIWMFNEALTAKNPNGEPVYPRADAVFQLHHEAIWKNPKNRSDNYHYQWLSSGNTPTIYMQESYSDVPKSVKYPIKEAISLMEKVRMISHGVEKKITYFSSTPDFALAMVAVMWKQGKKYKKVEVHGIELETETEYQYQKAGFGFWTGYLAALGIELVLYNSIFDFPMYGYEGDVAISSADFEKRISELTKELGVDRDHYNQEAKVFLDGLSRLLKADVSSQIQKELNELTQRGEAAGILNGKIKENSRYMEVARAMEEKTGAAVFSVGEFDQARIAHNKQYVNVRIEATNLNTQINLHIKRLLSLKKGSSKRQGAIDEFGSLIAQLMNKNMLMLHIVGAIRENQYLIDSAKLSFQTAVEGKV